MSDTAVVSSGRKWPQSLNGQWLAMLRFGVRALTEIGPEAEVSGEADVVGMGHHDVGHDPVLEAAHAVAEDHRRHRANSSKHSASSLSVVSRVSLAAKRTKR